MTWTKVVKTVTIVFAVIAILGSIIGASVVGSAIGDFEGFLAFLGVLIGGVLVTIMLISFVMMWVELAENVSSIKNELKNIKFKPIDETKNIDENTINGDKKFCQNCGIEVSENDDYCPACGYQIKNDVIVHKVVEEFNKNLKEKTPKENEHKCPNCGNVQNKSINRCLKCGQLISKKI